MNMIEEKIRKSANKFAEQEAEIGEIDRDALYKGFCNGAKWALSNLWRSVDEELPEDKQNILIYATYKGANDGKQRFLVEQYYYDKEYEKEGFRLKEGIGWHIELKVLAWMPIPPLPEARKEGEK